MSRSIAQRSSSGPLALVYLALLTYASLYPFGPWRWPPGLSFGTLLLLPWPPWRDAFDVWSNVLGYAPLGALLFVARLRARDGVARAAWVALAAAVLWSYAMEVAQQFLPGRVPSRVDWVLNAAGAAAGVALAAMLHRAGGLTRWQATRERWFVSDSAGALALLALWPVALLVPAPVPLGLGHVGEQLRALLAVVVDGVPWAAPVQDLLAASAGAGAEPPTPMTESLLQVLGLLGPCLLAVCVARADWRRVALVAGLATLAVVATSLSVALSFGPAHALAWMGPLSLPALGAGLLLALAGTLLPGRAAAALALVALTALVVLVAQVPVDPYYAGSLQSWEQGRFIRFNGLALWIGRLWPYAAMLWLLARVSRSGRG